MLPSPATHSRYMMIENISFTKTLPFLIVPEYYRLFHNVLDCFKTTPNSRWTHSSLQLLSLWPCEIWRRTQNNQLDWRNLSRLLVNDTALPPSHGHSDMLTQNEPKVTRADHEPSFSRRKLRQPFGPKCRMTHHLSRR